MIWMAGSSPAMTLERKFANVFIASSASGNIRVIKFRDDKCGASGSRGQSVGQISELCLVRHRPCGRPTGNETSCILMSLLLQVESFFLECVRKSAKRFSGKDARQTKA